MSAEINIVKDLLEKQAFPDAIKQTKELLLDSESDDLYFLLGAGYYLNKDFADALEIFHKLETRNPDYKDLFKTLGNLYKESALIKEKSGESFFRDAIQATVYYEKSIANSDTSSQVYLDCIFLYLNYFHLFPFSVIFKVKTHFEQIDKSLLDVNQKPSFIELNYLFTIYYERYEKNPSAMYFKSRKDLLFFLPPRGIVCELGVQEGLFANAILKGSSPKKLHLVDCWEKQDDDVYKDPSNYPQHIQDSLYKRVVDTFQEQIDSGQVVMHRNFSFEVLPEFSNHYFDWAYVDANHSYESVKADLLALYPKIKPGGYILGHDYIDPKYKKEFGVQQAVDEFVEMHDDIVFIGLTQEVYSTYLLKKIDA